MGKVTAATMASTLALSTLNHTAEVVTDDHWHLDEGLSRRNVQSHMFDGISLIEHQRQQMRDLMQQARHEQPPVSVSEMETMHRLVTAEKSDESAVRAQAERMAQEQVARQIEMTRIRNQIYRLLTPKQQTVLGEKHKQRMGRLRNVAHWRKNSSLNLLNNNDSRSQQ